MPADKRICAECVSDEYLKAEITKSSTVYQACDYCENVRPTIDMDSLAERCDGVIDGFYEVSSLTDSVVIYNRTPKGKPLVDVLEDMVSLPQEAAEDLAEVLTDRWFDYSSHEHLYGDDPWFIEKTKLSAPISTAWAEMEQSLRHTARFINPTAARMLESMFGPVLDDRTHEGKAVIVDWGPDCEFDTLYRARVFQTIEAMEAALSHPERHIGPPPVGVGVAGRMNAKGVSVFYGSTKKKLALSEVRPPVGCHVVMGEFKLRRKLRLLDLHELGSITFRTGASHFDPATAEEASRCEFLATLTQRMVMPVMPELEEHGYLITQAIADFLSTHPKLELDGILFHSAQETLSSQHTSDRNVVLFRKASVVLNAEANYGGRTDVNLWEYDEDNIRFEPEIWTEAPPNESSSNMPMWITPAQIAPTLELDRNTIEIYEVKGVEFSTSKHEVKQNIATRREGTEKWQIGQLKFI